MDRPERTQATGDASRRQIMPGAAPEPVRAAFRGRQVAEVPAAGPSPSRTKPQTNRASAGVSGSPGGPVVREAGRAGRRFQPYSVREPGRHPGASHPPAGEPSVPPVPQQPGQEPAARCRWKSDYMGIELRRQAAAIRGDTYAAAASVSALREVDQAVMNGLSTHLLKNPERQPTSTPDALKRLRNKRDNARHAGNQAGVDAIKRTLDDIYRLTHAKLKELDRRREEFRSVSLPGAGPVPDPASLGRWLQAQADAAPGADIEHSYFTHLARELSLERDPWTVSRKFMGSLPSTVNQQQAKRLQDAHGRLVRAIACGLSERPSESGGRALPGDFNWRTAYEAITSRCRRHTCEGNIYAAITSTSALHDIDRAILDAYFVHRTGAPQVLPYSAPDALYSLRRSMRAAAEYSADQSRSQALRRSLDEIYRLIHARNVELVLRENEFRWASLPLVAPVPDPQALERWLRSQADAAPGTDIEHSYFTHLARELSRGRDPWAVSRAFMECRPSPGDARQAERLKAAHGCLVRVMAGSLRLQQPAAVPPPVVAQAARLR